MNNPLDLSHRSIVVTGASSGIGRATAVSLSRLGARLVLVARDRGRLDQTRAMLDGDGHEVEPFDLADTDALPAWLKALAATTGPLHGVAHCAGAELLRPLQVMNSTQVEDLLRINVVSAIMLAKAFRQRGVHASPASLVFVSSVMGFVGEVGRSAYCASKGALHALTHALALELAREDIRVNCVAPGAVATEMSEKAASQMGEEAAAHVAGLHPLGMGQPDDVAHAIAYLLADTGRWVTGTIQTVDGGYTAR